MQPDQNSLENKEDSSEMKHGEEPGGTKRESENSIFDQKKSGKTVLGSLSVLGVLALKFKFYLMAAVKALSFLKFGGWIISPLITIGFYAMFFGVPYAVAIFVILLIHEMGHWIWMKALGLQPKMPVFLPFVAYVAMTKLPPDEATRAWVAIAGPLVGGVGSAVLFWFGVQNNNSWMLAAGNTGFFLNLFQLMPAKPFDGGFVIQAISTWLLIPGALVLLVLTFLFKSPLLFFIAIISIFSLYRQFAAERAARRQADTFGVVSRPASVVEKKQNPFGEPNIKSRSPFPDESPLAINNQISAPISSIDPGRLADPFLVKMQPATPIQRVLIAIAYIGLAGCLAWLYQLSSDELVVFLPHQK